MEIHIVNIVNIVKNDAQEKIDEPECEIPTSKIRERSERKVTGNRIDGANKPTSVSLTVEEKNALRAMHLRTHVSQSDLIRRGVRIILGSQSREQAPKSIGVADGIYSPTVQDDLVVLSNMILKLTYALGMLDMQITRTKRLQVRALIREAISQMETISGRVNANKNIPI